MEDIYQRNICNDEETYLFDFCINKREVM